MIDKLLLPFSLLFDPDGEVSRRYRVWDDEGQIARPASFVVDREGVGRYTYVGEDFADRPGDDELHAAVREAAR